MMSKLIHNHEKTQQLNKLDMVIYNNITSQEYTADTVKTKNLRTTNVNYTNYKVFHS